MTGCTTLKQHHLVYVLRSLVDGRNYVGYTTDLKKRVIQHNEGKAWSTRHRRPLVLIYFEGCLSKEDALRREKYLKTTHGRRYMAKRLKVFLSNSKLSNRL